MKRWLDHDNSAPNHVATLGYETLFRSRLKTNGDLIAEYVAGLGPEYDDRPLVLFGYSKGVPDIFAFLVQYPELTRVQRWSPMPARCGDHRWPMRPTAHHDSAPSESR